jgi:DNA-binding MarR family transcriptional regulator
MNAISQKTTQLTLALLDFVFEDSGVSQRRLATRLGIALGLANAHLRACVDRGLIMVSATSKRRFRYTLTDLGRIERIQLSRQHLLSSLMPYAQVRSACDELFDHCRANTVTQVAFAGGSYLAEVALLSAIKYDVDVIGLVNMGVCIEGVEHRFGRQDQFFGRPVWNSLQSFSAVLKSPANVDHATGEKVRQPDHVSMPCDAMVITDLSQPQLVQQQLQAIGLPVYAPQVLRLDQCLPRDTQFRDGRQASDNGHDSDDRPPANTLTRPQTRAALGGMNNERVSTSLNPLPKEPGVVSG